MIHGRILLSLASISLIVGVCLAAAPQQGAAPKTQPRLGPVLDTIDAQPAVRVRIVAGAANIAIGCDVAVTIGPANRTSNPTRPRSFKPTLSIRYQEGAFIIHSVGQSVRWALPVLRIDAPGSHTLSLGGRRYPRTLVIVPAADGRHVDVVNHLPLEQYLPGVLDHELYGSWHEQTFRAQAIAARSYAIWERHLKPQRHYDLEATTASQVYGGKVQNPKAIAAVKSTRGQVLVFEGRVLPAFYSSCVGTIGQDAAIAFPEVAPNIAPLRSGKRGPWDNQSPHYRWGAIYRSRVTLIRRLAAWGKANSHDVAKLRNIVAIGVSHRNAAGRPARFRVTDGSGRTFALAAESFRFACNYQAAQLPRLNKKQQLKSSHVDVAIAGKQIAFTNGRGFGHGVGLSQWGAQALAARGYKASAILNFYYPGAQIRTAY
jgi:stage II sporulation protein D